MTTELSNERLRALYRQFRDQDPWPEWLAKWKRLVETIASMNVAEFSHPDAQRRLWKARDISGVGPGESVNCERVITDPEVVAALWEIKTRNYSHEPVARAEAIQSSYDRLLALISPRLSERKPQAKLARVFLALLPAQTHVSLSETAQKALRGPLLSSRKGGPLWEMTMARAKLRDALGREETLDEHIHRAQFCWWLSENMGDIEAGRDPRAVAPPDAVIEEEVAEVAPPPAQPAVAPPPRWPTWPELRASFGTDPGSKALVLPDSRLQALHLAWHSQAHKRFVLLSGLSGTGKTKILTEYARIYLHLMGLDPAEHLALVPVSPDWRDPSGLLGYENALHADPTFQAEPALRLLVRAARDPGRPYFLVLDEMNLARAELYFAPLLSAMETAGDLRFHGRSADLNGVPPQIGWPRNLFIGGTVNMDETTHPFSDKVLDRAFTMEFWDVDLPALFDRRAHRQPAVEGVLLSLAASLTPIRRHFGYRTAAEILDYVYAARSLGLDEAQVQDALDEAVFAKVLPKIRGEDSPELRKALETLHQSCARDGLPRSANKLAEMAARLKQSGLTRFWA